MTIKKCRRMSDWYDPKRPKCTVCKGTGHDPSPRTWIDNYGTERECTCPGCGGFGNARPT